MVFRTCTCMHVFNPSNNSCRITEGIIKWFSGSSPIMDHQFKDLSMGPPYLTLGANSSGKSHQIIFICLDCIPIFLVADLERKREHRRSLLRHSENLSQTTKVDPSMIVLPDERSSRSKKLRIPKSPNEVHAVQVPSPPKPQCSGTAQLNYSSRRTKAKCCLTSDCDRYGDPSFDGYCSLCYERFSPGLLVPRS